MRRLSALCLLTTITSLVSASAPYQVTWNTIRSYGPDGPWPVVTIQVGSDAKNNWLDTVDLHPGGINQYIILTKQFCNGKTASQWPAAAAGLYDVKALQSAINMTTKIGAPAMVWQWGSEAAQNLSGSASWIVDSVALEGENGGAQAYVVGKCSIIAVDEWMIELPNGTKYSSQVRTLSLEATGTQAFSNVPNYGEVDGNNVPIFGTNNGDIPSGSFGLHYGSVPLNQVGSLIFGGYDQSRVLGDAAAFEFVGGNNQVVAGLLDIQIKVETGGTPFNISSPYPSPSSEPNTSYIRGLLQKNTSFYDGQPTLINPIERGVQ